MRRYLLLLLALLAMPAPLLGDYLVMSRSAYLKDRPRSDSDSVTRLEPHTSVILLQDQQENGFYRVRIPATGETGWVYRTMGRRYQGLPEEPKDESPRAVDASSPGGSTAHIGPPRLYPDPSLTPGWADTLKVEDLTKRYTENCPSGKTSCTYSQAHRNVPRSVHTQVYDEYSVPQAKRNIENGEVDHFQPLCAGGANELKNLWYQPETNDWNGKDFGFHAKDKLEAYVCAQIKAGKLDPKDAYGRMTSDWVKFYLDEGLDDDEN